jgi:putative ATPase
MDLFALNDSQDTERSFAPLADRMRPLTLSEFLGQTHILGENKLLRQAIESDQFSSMIFFGPPGCGKTTLAELISRHSKAAFVQLNAVEATVKEVREIIEEAKNKRSLYGQKTILFLDEVHRFNRARQDVLLPSIEKGDIIFIGATTENPVHHVNDALLSRSTLYHFHALTNEDVKQALEHALTDSKRGIGDLNIQCEEGALEWLAEMANGDVRRALNALELAARITSYDANGFLPITKTNLAEALRQPLMRADLTTQYDVLSAFHKTVRASQIEAVHWFLYGVEKLGMDPQVFVRRLLIATSEDIGMADSQAAVHAFIAYQAFERIGWPEAKYNIVHAIQYAVSAPKSRAIADLIAKTMDAMDAQVEWSVPRHLRNH